jgi:hypothetical protein
MTKAAPTFATAITLPAKAGQWRVLGLMRPMDLAVQIRHSHREGVHDI